MKSVKHSLLDSALEYMTACSQNNFYIKFILINLGPCLYKGTKRYRIGAANEK